MNDSTVSSERFGEVVAAALGTGPSKSTLSAQRIEILALTERLSQTQARSGLWRWGFAGAAVLAAAAAFILLIGSSARTPVRASFGGKAVADAGEVWTLGAQSRPLDFSDGSQVLLGPDTRAVVSRITRERADLRLSQGKIVASIQKKTGVTWTIGVGPYAVRVVGTRFSVDWQGTTRTLKVEVSEGRVRVFGGDLNGDGVALDAGAHLERHYGTDAPDPTRSSPVTTTGAERSEPSAQGVVDPPAPSAALPAGTRVEPSAPSPANGFQSLAAKGKYREALAAAERQGFSELVANLPENDLVMLANAARFGGNSARAHQALLALRQRFAGRPGAELGALYLARTAEDLDKSPTEAVRWLRTFLSESPRGDLAAGARANLMALLLKQGDKNGARSVAEDYLRYHPNGPHAAQARGLLGQTQP